MVKRAEPQIESNDEVKTPDDSASQESRKNGIPWPPLIALMIVAIACGGSIYAAYNDSTYDNWRGAYPLRNSVELTDDAGHLNGAVNYQGSCYPEENGSRLQLVRYEDGYVLAAYRTPRVSDDIFTRCPDNTQLVMTVRDWNRIIRHEQWLQDERDEETEAARVREEAVRRLTR